MTEHEKTLRDWLSLYQKHGTLTAGPLACLEAMLVEHRAQIERKKHQAAQAACDAAFSIWGDAVRAQQVADAVLGGEK